MKTKQRMADHRLHCRIVYSKRTHPATITTTTIISTAITQRNLEESLPSHHNENSIIIPSSPVDALNSCAHNQSSLQQLQNRIVATPSSQSCLSPAQLRNYRAIRCIETRRSNNKKKIIYSQGLEYFNHNDPNQLISI